MNFEPKPNGQRARRRDRRFHLSRAHRAELLEEFAELRPVVADRWNQSAWIAAPAVRRSNEIRRLLALNGWLPAHHARDITPEIDDLEVPDDD